MSTEDIQALLREHGYRVTQPRRAVWRALVETGGHLTADEIAGLVRESDPGVNLASVYRTLDLFESLELVRESRIGNGAGHWELAHPDEHFHLVCDECGRIEHHVGTLVEDIRAHLSAGHGFQTRDIELIVSGRCADCTA